MNKRVIIFTLNGCDHCKELKDYLLKLNINFLDIDISVNNEQWLRIVKLTGQDVVPTVYLTDIATDIGVIYVPFNDFKNTEEIVEIIKSYLNLI